MLDPALQSEEKYHLKSVTIRTTDDIELTR